MKLIVGLGNPGRQYQFTRHNIGFMVIDNLIKELNLINEETKFSGEFIKTKYQNQDIILLKPLTFMNLSGGCVVSFMNFFKIKPEDVLIIHDEIDLDFGRIQFKSTGSAAGHNGLKDIFLKTNSNNFTRLRIGVGRNPNFTTVNWVLSNFSDHELLRITDHQKLFFNAILNWVENGNINQLMNKFNNQQF
ncbi:MAG: aminoacyl-tRNA hydrolase [Spiroplasma sp.]|nr:aminoacyl-tRNA hydrolase [Spiroplasma sp.]